MARPLIRQPSCGLRCLSGRIAFNRLCLIATYIALAQAA
jgi:hypothetical protein